MLAVNILTIHRNRLCVKSFKWMEFDYIYQQIYTYIHICREREREIASAFIIIHCLNQHQTVTILLLTFHRVNLELMVGTIRGRVRRDIKPYCRFLSLLLSSSRGHVRGKRSTI